MKAADIGALVASKVATEAGIPIYGRMECGCCEGWGHHPDDEYCDGDRSRCEQCDGTGVLDVRSVGEALG